MGVSVTWARGILALALFAAGPAAFAQRNLEPRAGQGSEQRVALVIGNAAYQQGALRNPVNDARAMAERLQRLGFVVIKRENMKAKEIGPALREFRSRLSAGATALFFYAGHGLQVKGVNYLPTVDADIEAEDDVYTQALDVAKVLELMDEAKTRVNLVFLDACRNNPFSRRFRSAAQGLAKVDAPSGTLISFATRPGSVAADGDGKNGLYTEYLLKHMEIPGLPIEQVLKRTGAGVKLASKGRQEPWSEGLIEGEFYFRASVQAPSAASAPAAAAPDPAAVEFSIWDSIKASSNPEDFKAYLEQYPNGQFSAFARNRLNASVKPQAPPAAPAVAMAPQQPPAKPAVSPTRQLQFISTLPPGVSRDQLLGTWYGEYEFDGFAYKALFVKRPDGTDRRHWRRYDSNGALTQEGIIEGEWIVENEKTYGKCRTFIFDGQTTQCPQLPTSTVVSVQANETTLEAQGKRFVYRRVGDNFQIPQ